MVRTVPTIGFVDDMSVSGADRASWQGYPITPVLDVVMGEPNEGYLRLRSPWTILEQDTSSHTIIRLLRESHLPGDLMNVRWHMLVVAGELEIVALEPYRAQTGSAVALVKRNSVHGAQRCRAGFWRSHGPPGASRIQMVHQGVTSRAPGRSHQRGPARYPPNRQSSIRESVRSHRLFFLPAASRRRLTFGFA